MSTFRLGGRIKLLLCSIPLLLSWTWVQAGTPDLGQELSEGEVAAIDATILPNGDGLPAGSGNARTGKALYQTHCLSCHGAKGTNGLNDRLAGGHGSLTSAAPIKTVGSYWPYATTVFDYIRRAMPYTAPGSLSADETYALTAYILFLNEVVGETESLNSTTLPAVIMPNTGNFDWGMAKD